MNISSLINSPGLWIACGIMVAVVVGQSLVFHISARKHAPNVGLSPDQVNRGMRSAMLTAIGPSFSPVIVMLSLIAILGAPTTWMRMNDIGAARTELAMSNLAAGALGGQLQAGAFTAEMFSAATWGMALNNMGWMIVTLLLTHRMAKALGWLNEKYDPKWIKAMMAGAMMGLFGYLLANGVVGKASPFYVAAIASGASMLLITKTLKKYPRLQELALGISMIVGMTVATVIS